MTQVTQIPNFTKLELSNERAIAVCTNLRDGFDRGLLRDVNLRKGKLKALKDCIHKYEDALFEALKQDLGKPAFEAYTSEIGFCYQEIDHTIEHLNDWTQTKSCPVGMALWPTSAMSYQVPKGVALIISPWNYPLNLALAPLIAAIAAGCTVLLKPAEDTPHTSATIQTIVEEVFTELEVAVVQGAGSQVVPVLMDCFRFDHVFYTGSTSVGRIIGEQCGRELIPCTLELGGKSPAIVMADADLDVAADRLLWGKFLNAGQTCVAPDYCLVHQDVFDVFLRKLKTTLDKSYGANPQESNDFARIINDKHYERLSGLIANNTCAHGGQTDGNDRYISPTLLKDIDLDSETMTDEIFGPVLPLIPFSSWAEAKAIVSRNPNPLAAYLFTKSSDSEKSFIEELQFGGGCINDTVIHLGIPSLPFGGVQQSGLGRYHSDAGFKTFSNQRSIASTTTRINVPTRFAPYSDALMKAVKLILR